MMMLTQHWSQRQLRMAVFASDFWLAGVAGGVAQLLVVRPHSRFMKHTHQIILAGLLSLFCALQAEAGSSGQFITTFGGVSSSNCPWVVSVSAKNQAFHISYRYSGTNYSASLSADSPADWKAKTGWFVFIESDERIWAYDGGSSLDLLATKIGKLGPTLTSYGSSSFPCPVPAEVFARLTPEAQKAIKKGDMTMWPLKKLAM